MEIPSETRIGHVHLKVSDLEKSLAFYHHLLGFNIVQRIGSQAVFLSAGGYHHHIALNTWESEGGRRPLSSMTGLYHVAILYPSRINLAHAVKRLLDNSWPISGASDHGVSEAIYLADPDENGIELYHDRQEEEWPFESDGSLRMHSRPLDLQELLTHASKTDSN